MRLLTFLFAISLLVFSLSLPNFVFAAPTQDLPSRTEDLALLTNAQRFARGLGPKKPNYLARGVDSPTLPRAQNGHYSHPSPKPPTLTKRHHHGLVRVWDSKTKSPLGYISKDTVFSRYKYSSKDSLEVSFDLDDGATAGKGLELTLDNSDARGFGLLGLVVPAGGQTLGTYSQAWISSVNSSPASAPASYPGNAHGQWTPSESAVWNVDLLTKLVTPCWTQKDYSHPSLAFVSTVDGSLSAINLPSPNAPFGYTLVYFTFEEL